MIAIVSACLLGINCRYNGGSVLNKDILKLVESGKIIPIPVCPEQLAGLPTPRKTCEIVGGDGFDVLNGRARVLTRDGDDITDKLVKGAEEVLKIAKLTRAEVAIMKSFSPSCGCGTIYDGSFTGKKKEGYGVTSALLKLNGIKVISDAQAIFEI
jgi:uncharacterized protein YbbK (DUF523 family)